VTRASVEALNAESGRASTDNGGEGRLLRRAAVDDSPAVSALLRAAESRVLESGGSHRFASAGRFALGCRISGPGMEIGTLALVRRGHPFTEDDQALVGYLCAQVGIAAANVMRHESLHQQALTDELTGLANHRRFQEMLARAVDRHGREGMPASLVLLDLDDFKSINDGHGHQTGDTVLRAVGACLREHCRAPDEPARYGGEELAIVVEAPLSDACELAERIRRSVGDLRLITADGTLLRVGVSAGVATAGPGRASAEALIAAADGALYAAKRAGKNIVIPADGPSPRPAVPAGA
jgi:diguanylate cyclase (GGDEF)-like protein